VNDRELYETGRAHMDAGRLREAVEAFRLSADASPHFKTLELLGECYLRLGEHDRAIVPLAAATTLNLQSRAPSILAEVFERLGNLDRAEEMARVALSRDGANKRAQGVLARLAKE
jgi:tetratricopeptide (TPR) repeat protein